MINSIYHPPSAATSFKFLALRLFKIPWIRYLQNQPSVCQRAIILQGEIIQGKPKIRFSYFSMRNPYMKFQHHILMPHTYIHTYRQAETNMSPLFQSLGHTKRYIQHFGCFQGHSRLTNNTEALPSTPSPYAPRAFYET